MKTILTIVAIVLLGNVALIAQSTEKGQKQNPHGKEVSSVAIETPSGPGKGEVVSSQAQTRREIKLLERQERKQLRKQEKLQKREQRKLRNERATQNNRPEARPNRPEQPNRPDRPEGRQRTGRPNGPR